MVSLWLKIRVGEVMPPAKLAVLLIGGGLAGTQAVEKTPLEKQIVLLRRALGLGSKGGISRADVVVDVIRVAKFDFARPRIDRRLHYSVGCLGGPLAGLAADGGGSPTRLLTEVDEGGL